VLGVILHPLHLCNKVRGLGWWLVAWWGYGSHTPQARMPRKDQLRRLGPEFEPNHRATPVRSAAVVRDVQDAQQMKAEAESAWETVQTKPTSRQANAAVAAAEQEAFRVVAKEAEARRKAQVKAEEAREVAKAVKARQEARAEDDAAYVTPTKDALAKMQTQADGFTTTIGRDSRAAAPADSRGTLGLHNCATLRNNPDLRCELLVGDQICLQVPGRQDDTTTARHPHSEALVCLNQRPLRQKQALVALQQSETRVPLLHIAVFEICSINAAGEKLPKGGYLHNTRGHLYNS
jgi:hypothetical protein